MFDLRSKLSLLLLLLLFGGGLWPAPAYAYVRAKNTAGQEIFWPRSSSVAVVKFHIQQEGLGDYFARNPKLGTAGSEFFAVQAGFFAWSTVTCADARPVGLRALFQGRLPNAQVGYDDKCASCNQNVIVFVRDRSQWRHDIQLLSKTTVTTNATTGAILDADIEINATGQYALSTQIQERDNIRWDLQNIMTHEAGKFLGLGESTDFKSTMAAKTSQGDLSLRSLESDDIKGICAVYPPDPKAATIPTYQEAEVERALGCSTTSEKLPPLGLGVALLLLAWIGLRTRSSSTLPGK